MDGWNTIHAHSNLARMLESEDAQGAQSALSIMLEPIHDFDGARVTIVYDGNGADRAQGARDYFFRSLHAVLNDRRRVYRTNVRHI